MREGVVVKVSSKGEGAVVKVTLVLLRSERRVLW